MRLRFIAVTYALLISGMAAPSVAQQIITVRTLLPPEARSTSNFGSILNVRSLSNGGVLVNDGTRRQLVLLNMQLNQRTVVIDSLTTGGQSYGPRATPLIPYLADSTLFVDGASSSLLVIDGNGKIARVTAAPRPGDLRFIAASASGSDAQGNLIYRGPLPRGEQQRATVPGAIALAGLASPPPTDSAPLLRASFETRRVDTIARVKMPTTSRGDMTQSANGTSTLVLMINPMITVDEWAVLSDGTIAIVRGHDYHIDLIQRDGKRVSGARMPFDWKRLTDEDKQALIDSARTAEEKRIASARAAGVDLGAASKSADEIGGNSGGLGSRVGGDRGDGGGKGGGDRGGEGSREDKPRTQNVITKLEFVPLKNIADYYPAIRSGAAIPDLDGNLWILPTTSAQSKAGELVYDVVNNRGQLVERVRLPVNRAVAGFGHNGVVYLMHRDATQGWVLERTRLAGGVNGAQ